MRAEKGLAGILLRDGIISQDEVEIVEYGLENLGGVGSVGTWKHNVGVGCGESE